MAVLGGYWILRPWRIPQAPRGAQGVFVEMQVIHSMQSRQVFRGARGALGEMQSIQSTQSMQSTQSIQYIYVYAYISTRAQIHAYAHTHSHTHTHTNTDPYIDARLFARLCCRPRYSNAGEGLAHPSVLRPDHGRSRHLSQSCLFGDAATRLESKQWQFAFLPGNANLVSQRPRQCIPRVATSS